VDITFPRSRSTRATHTQVDESRSPVDGGVSIAYQLHTDSNGAMEDQVVDVVRRADTILELWRRQELEHVFAQVLAILQFSR
jgi:hypothetical protein